MDKMAHEGLTWAEAMLDGMTLEGLETWANPVVTPDKLFFEFMRMKIAAEHGEKTTA